MAFKARGLADIVITDRGRKIETRPASPSANAGGTMVTVDGVNFTHRLEKYPGEPTVAQLAANNLDIRTLKGRPWPGSATDRHCVPAPNTAPRTNRFGQEIALAGPSSMEMAKLRGQWPDAEEKQAQAIRDARFKDNAGVTRAIALARGMKPEEAEALANRHAQRGSMEHLAAVVAETQAPPASKPVKPSAATKPSPEL